MLSYTGRTLQVAYVLGIIIVGNGMTNMRRDSGNKKRTIAKTLGDIYKTVSPEPLETREDLRVFYRGDINSVRGGDIVKAIQFDLDQAYGGAYCKACLYGHAGCGKSTELSRLIFLVEDKFETIRFSVLKELDPSAFKPFDILLLMMSELLQHAVKAGLKVPEKLLEGIWEWFATEDTTIRNSRQITTEAAAGVGVPSASWLAKVLGIFGNLKGEMKYAASRERTRTDYRLSRLSELIQLANNLLDKCNEALRKKSSKEWLFIGEDFDKPGIELNALRDLFITYANVFRDIRAHLIFTIPITLIYSHESPRLPFPDANKHCLPDIPVFDRNHQPNQDGRKGIQQILEARVAPDLFEEGQIERLIVASGGNIRDLFTLILESTRNALVKDAKALKLKKDDVNSAISKMRTEYRRKLGISDFDTIQVDYDAKAEKLVEIYNGNPVAAQIPDNVTYTLLHARAVQEFNGERWFGVHPLVVDILREQEKIQSSSGGTSGGT
jgi:ABC-type dipeptide/oligopeptide/nickel transport system ATPase subunit